jgi:hypothetical protein
MNEDIKMAVRVTGTGTHSLDAVFPEALRHFKLRELKWLWRYLLNRGYLSLDIADINPSDQIREMTRYINLCGRTDMLIVEILNAYKDMLVGKEHFEWVDKQNARMLIFLFSNFMTNPRDPYQRLPAPLLVNMPSIDRYDAIIFEIDTCIWPLIDKQQFWGVSKSLWGKVISSKVEEKWLDIKNEDQLIWAWSYLKSHHKHVLIPEPINNSERHAAILASLDLMFQSAHPAERKLFWESMKKAWNQRKYRSSDNVKKPVYLALSNSARTKLEKLVEHYEGKPSDVIERLIAQEYLQISSHSNR